MKDSPSRNKTESPKTPGGISKSLLTPCRRVGLSRKWRKSTCSPFISPLATQNSNTPDNTEKECKKRRKCSDNEVASVTPLKDRLEKGDSCKSPQPNADITTTPSRSTQLPRKKSKTLQLSQENKQEILNDESVCSEAKKVNKEAILEVPDIEVNEEDTLQSKDKVENTEKVTKLSRNNSKSKSKLSLKKSHSRSASKIKKPECPKVDAKEPSKESLNNLTKKCIVVIQKKILNVDENPIESNQKLDTELEDVPLSELKKDKDTVTLNTLHDDDFITTKKSRKKKLSLTIKRNNSANELEIELDKSSQSSQENDEILSKRTILIRKSYSKVDKPTKAKSTGSITQKDIDELKARIEMKKKLLLAKAMSVETEELRSLIKKWQKGCQEALMELLELMKKKLPDRPYMDYAEILKLLNIPAELVGYDSDNDCFVTPEDTNILLNSFKL